MDLSYSQSDIAFADEVRSFIQANLNPETKNRVLAGKLPSRAQRAEWQKILLRRGWGAPAWPTEYGGTGWSIVEKHLFEDVMAEEGAPHPPVFGMGMLAPVLMKFGSEAQKRHYIPRILSLEDWWCQGFSEPGAGSDLASLKSRAERSGDEWILNGQKIWTTLAHVADMMFCLVRTSREARKQEGISLLLVDMKSPGVTVRPLITIDGEHEVNEVFLDNVRVPAANIVGEVGKGWDYAKYLLSHERTGIARVGQSKREIKRLKAIAALQPTPAGRLIEDPAFQMRVAALEIDLMALEITTLRMIASLHAGPGAGSGAGPGAGPGVEANILKIKGSELQQDIAECMMDAVGLAALPFVPVEDADSLSPLDAGCLAPTYFNMRKVSIYGGSNEVQRNILSKVALGL